MAILTAQSSQRRATSWFSVREPAYPLGPRFAGPRQGPDEGLRPLDPRQVRAPGGSPRAVARLPPRRGNSGSTPPATDTMSPNPAAWCVRIAPRVGRGVVPLRYERADDGFGRGVQRRGRLGVRRGAQHPLPDRDVKRCVGWLSLSLSLSCPKLTRPPPPPVAGSPCRSRFATAPRPLDDSLYPQF